MKTRDEVKRRVQYGLDFSVVTLHTVLALV